MGIATEPHDILRFAVDALEAGRRVALVTLAGIDGSSSRALGSQMAIDDSGASCGSFSGGCIDAAVIAEAREAIALARGRKLRFGAGSPFIDVRLPCGGGLDLLFTPVIDPAPLRLALNRLAERRPAFLRFSEAGVTPGDREGIGRRDGHFALTYHPPLQVVAFGQGEELLALARLTKTFGCVSVAATPRPETIGDLRELCDDVIALRSLSMPLPALGDRWTAFVFLFHDHDWETALLPQILSRDGFYFGTIGSHRTQANRIAMLQRQGLEKRAIDRLRGPIGLLPSTRDPASLAISILAEVVGEYRQCACAPAVEGPRQRALARTA